ncbi:MAG: dihydrofolate reductase [Pseudomonadota bacterium]|jgi:dihydrofolate reductase
MTGGPIRLSLIAAVARNGVIGVDNRLPWKLPGDLKFFKRTTMGKPMVLGRKTWESFGGRPLPGRPHIVLTRDPAYTAEGATVLHDLDRALAEARRLAAAAGGDEAMVIGGEALFRDTLPLADRVYLTEVDADPAGDAFFPDIDHGRFRETELERAEVAGPDSPAYRILVLDRCN